MRNRFGMFTGASLRSVEKKKNGGIQVLGGTVVLVPRAT